MELLVEYSHALADITRGRDEQRPEIGGQAVMERLRADRLDVQSIALEPGIGAFVSLVDGATDARALETLRETEAAHASANDRHVHGPGESSPRAGGRSSPLKRRSAARRCVASLRSTGRFASGG